MGTILQLIELDSGGFDLKRRERGRLGFRPLNEIVAKNEPVGADAHDIVLRERHGTVENLFIHKCSVGRFQVGENGTAVGIEYDLGVESREGSSRMMSLSSPRPMRMRGSCKGHAALEPSGR